MSSHKKTLERIFFRNQTLVCNTTMILLQHARHKIRMGNVMQQIEHLVRDFVAAFYIICFT